MWEDNNNVSHRNLLDVVSEYADPVYIEFVTAYIPDEQEWESPPFRRRKQKT
jgi:hypothetical protein